MSTTTTNYSFKKPAQTDNYNIDDQNGNWDLADTQIKAANDNILAITGTSNADITEVKAVLLETDTRSLAVTYTGSQLTKLEEKDGATVVESSTLEYNANGQITAVVEVAGGKTVRTSFTYDAGTGLLTGTPPKEVT